MLDAALPSSQTCEPLVDEPLAAMETVIAPADTATLSTDSADRPDPTYPTESCIGGKSAIVGISACVICNGRLSQNAKIMSD
jgi:hypothetical protein